MSRVSNLPDVLEVAGSKEVMRSMVSSQNSIRYATPSNVSMAGKMSTVSPLARKQPRLNSISLLLYKASTKRRNSVLRLMVIPVFKWMMLEPKARGSAMPYKQETEETTMTSLLPESSEAVVRKRSLSISSLISSSFSM